MTRTRWLASSALAVACITAMSAEAASAGIGASRGEWFVTVTNLTHGVSFTPILVASHATDLHVFTVGTPASPELRTLAESGNPMPLAELLTGTMGVHNVVTGSGLTMPGASTTLAFKANPGEVVSLAAMLIPTNDGFVGLDGVQLPSLGHSETLYAMAFDAGTEVNDELCSSIPGPDYDECGGPGGGAQVGGGEGFVFIHSGMHGVGDFDAALRDWRNPIARITISNTPPQQ